MWFRFDNPDEPGVIDVNCYQVAFYDEKDICFDESYFAPDEIDNVITFVETEEDKKKENIDHSKVFVHFNNGDIYEIKLKKVKKNTGELPFPKPNS